MPSMKKTLTVTAFVAVTASLSGCMPHLNKQQCQTMNWRQLGFTDGSQGKSQRNLSRDIQDCAKFQLKVNTKKYAQGWRAGTRQYCRPNTAYQLGVNGQTYNHVCPTDLSASFDRAWRRGLRKYCIPGTGYNLGRAGRAMPTFCTGGQAVRFRNSYQAGYRQFQAQRDIQAQVNNTQRQINDTQNQINDRQNQINRSKSQLS